MTSTTLRGRWFLLRAVAVPTLVMLALTGYLVTSRVLATHDAAGSLTGTADPVEKVWESDYSRRFPGCVATVLWPGNETPRALVVQWRSGEVERVPRGVALRRALSDTHADDARIIGACYR